MKLGVIGGAGQVGATAAFYVASRGLASEIILYDLKENLAESHAMDIEQAVAVMSGTKLSAGGLDSLKDCDIIINAAGIPEIKAASRDVYLSGNIKILRGLAEKIAKWGTAPVILSATNPIDVLNYSFFELTGLPREKFIGFTINDSVRFIWAASKETGIPSQELSALVIGEHGAGQVPIFSTLRKSGADLPLDLNSGQRENILSRVNNWFGEYQNLDSGRSSGWTSGVGLCRVIECITSNNPEPCPCSVIPDGEYGLRGLSIGLPVRLCESGVREIVELPLTVDESKRLNAAADKIRGLIASGGPLF